MNGRSFTSKMFVIGTIILMAAIIAFALMGCAGGPLTTREKGGLIGAGSGAVIGGAVSQSWWGALLGGVLGGVGGGLVGDQLQKNEQAEDAQQKELEKNQQEINRQKKEIDCLKKYGPEKCRN